jgi:small subunit ribosomal protein S6
MAKAPPIYDLMLLLSTGAPDELRAKILSDVEQAIASGGGTIERNDDWGTRTLAYQIEHQSDAEYHLLQFSGPPSLLEALSHSLKIADGVLRFRIIKVLPGTPPAPDPRSAAPAAAAPAAPVAVSSEPAEAAAEA